MFEFTIPEGEYYHSPETGLYVFKDLVFTENSWKKAKEAIKEFIEDGSPFSLVFTPKEKKCS